MMSKTKLTEKQEAFIDALFTSETQGGAGGDPVKAKTIAGYSENTPTKSITDALKDEISEGVLDLFVSEAPKAAFKVINAMSSPGTPGIKVILSSAASILDRGGFVKKEKIEIEASGGVFILPEKE
jgi:hypothetical protein